MDLVTLGRTGITVNKNGFGALPIQRISQDVPGNAPQQLAILGNQLGHALL